MRYLIIILILIVFSFKSEEKKYKVELTLEQWNGVLNVLDQSNANHTQVKAVSGWLVSQIQPQLNDTTKNGQPKP